MTTEFSAAYRSTRVKEKLKLIRHNMLANLGMVAAAGALMGANIAREVISPTKAYADTIDDALARYPYKDMPCEHAPYNVSGSCANYDWGPSHTESFNDTSELNPDTHYAYRNCTDWVATRIKQLAGYTVSGSLGNGGDWYDNSPKEQRSSTPKAWDAAVIPATYDTKGNETDPGHVAFVESVGADGKSMTVSEYNHDAKGNGDQRTITIVGSGFTEFVDFGVHPSGTNVSTVGRLAFINSLNAGFAKDEIAQGGWHTLTGNGDAQAISAAGTHLAVITGGGRAAGADVTADKLKTNSPGLMDLNVPLNPNYPGGVKYIDIDDHGDMIAINNCNSAYGWRNDPGQLRWVQLTGCGDAQKVSVGNRRFGLVNACGGAYNSDTGYAWTQDLPCGNAKDIAIGETQRIMVLTRDNTAYIYDPGSNSWINKTPVGDAQNIAIGKDRLMVITSGGAAWAADVGQDAHTPMTRLTSDGDASAIAVGAHDRMALINGAGAAFASDEIIANGKWTQESGNGDAKAIAVG
jgi:surface antigen